MIIRNNRCVICLAGIVMILSCARTNVLADPADKVDAGSDGPGGRAVFTITNDVLVSGDKIQPVGVNRAGDPGGTKYSRNTFVRNSGNEPFNLRLMARIRGIYDDGSVWLDTGTDRFLAYKDGYRSGANVRIYRLVNTEGENLPLEEKEKNGYKYSFINTKDAHHVRFVGKTRVVPIGDKKLPMGGWTVKLRKHQRKPKLMQGDYAKSRVYFTDKIDFHPGDYLFFEQRTIHIDPRTIKPGKINWPWVSESVAKMSYAYHDAPLPKEMLDPGESCLKVDAKQGKNEINQFFLFGDGGYYGPMELGKTYRMEVWLRQKGLDGGDVKFSFTNLYDVKKTFKVTEKWQKFTCDLVGKKHVIIGNEPENLYGPKFTFSGPGTLWMDNCRIYRYDNDTEADLWYTPGKLTLNQLLDHQPRTGKKGAIRFWSGLGQMSMKSLVSMHGDSHLNLNAKRFLVRECGTISKPLTFVEATGSTAGNRMVPWLIIQVTFSEDEYRGLIEYLGAPYDPATDTPKSKPYAYKRYQQRGHGRPWTDTFREIIIEFGNENWHNRFPKFPSWIGFGELCAIHKGGKEYGIFTRYYIEEIMKSPYWKAGNLGEKIKFNLGGSRGTRIDKKTGKVTGYGQSAIQENPYASYEGHATYMGALWEYDEKTEVGLGDSGFQRTLLDYRRSKKANHENTFASLAEMRKQGFTRHDIVSYEGGPSGFPIGTGSAEYKRACNLAGHSMAIGVAALDCWLDTYRLGWTYHCYYFYGQGGGWNSHSQMMNGFLPSPAFMLMGMRNRNLRGDMLVTKTNSSPSLPRSKTPLAVCYSFRDGDRYSVAVLSLKLDGKHSGADFGDGYTPVTLNLPFKSASKITMEKLVGNPRETNMTSEKIKIVAQKLPASAVANGVFKINETTGGNKQGLPPGTVFMYVFEGVK